MIVLLLLILIVGGLFGYLIWKHSEEPPLDIDPEAAHKAAIELHRIRRRLDSAWLKTEQRQEAARLRREISEALDRDDDAP